METTGAERTSIFVGLVAAFVAAVEVIQAVRVGLFLDAEPSWQPVRYLLALFAVCVAGSIGILAAGVCWIVARSRWGSRAALPLPVRHSSLLALGGSVLALGILLRLAGLISLGPLWVDDLSELRPAIELKGQMSDLPPWTYPVPFREGRWGGSVGTLYLELFRLCLKTFGTTILGIRAPSVLGGILSLLTAALLGRAFLPRGGGVLVALILAGLRWSLIVSQWGWSTVFVTPFLDLAALSMLAARRRRRPMLAVLSGAITGLGAHVHIAAWIAAVALGLWALWPSARARAPRRILLATAFSAGFLLAVFPVIANDPFGHYFSRISKRSHPPAKIPIESRIWWNVETAHAAITGPWWTPDLVPRHDLPGRLRLEWIVGLALAAAMLKSVLSPKDELSAYLLASAAAAFLSTMAWGRGETPNSYRYSYLSTTTALAAASGVLWVLSAVPWSRRRGAAYAVLGAFAISGVFGARDALIVWPNHSATFAGFRGQDTLIGQAAARWEVYGRVSVDPEIVGDRTVIENVHAFRLVPYADPTNRSAMRRALSLRIVPPDISPTASERLVERVTDSWGREWALVLASFPAKLRSTRPTLGADRLSAAPRTRVHSAELGTGADLVSLGTSTSSIQELSLRP